MTDLAKKEWNWTAVLIASVVFACIMLSVFLTCIIAHNADAVDNVEPTVSIKPVSHAIIDRFEALVSKSATQAYHAVLDAKKVFWIPENAGIAPLPNARCYGETDDPASLQWLLDDAAEVLDGQSTLFSADLEIYPNSDITYYLDESILVITWQQLIDDYVYTFSEVKVTHPSQFRRYLANNEYDSDYIHPVSRMGTMANAVMAASADFYRGRNHGIIVYEGEVKRANYSELLDTCFIDNQGNLIFVRAGELVGVEAAQQFVDQNNIDFSIAFGPILVENGKRCEPDNYYLGEINDEYPRAALCQKDKLHYVVVVSNEKDHYRNHPTLHDFASRIDELGCQMAYTLDGGKTGTIAMNGKALNPVPQHERWISDIILFATAIPSAEPATEETQP